MTRKAIGFCEKLKKTVSDLVRCYITLLHFPWNKIIQLGMGEKMFHKKNEVNLAKSLISFLYTLIKKINHFLTLYQMDPKIKKNVNP